MKKLNKNSNKKKYLKLLLLFGVIGFLFFIYQLYTAPSKKFYKNFGIEIPTKYNVHGIDVSKYQENINWPLVKAMKDKNINLTFVFIKATEGISINDNKFRYNWENSKKNQIIRGAYHYFLPNRSALQQANHFVKKVNLEKGDLPPVVDIEDLVGTSPATMKKGVKQFLKLLENHYGVKPIIYSYANFYTSYLGKEFDEYPLWIAHYKEKNKPEVEREWIFWQHSEEGNVNGINSKVDFNVFNGDISDLKALLIQ